MLNLRLEKKANRSKVIKNIRKLSNKLNKVMNKLNSNYKICKLNKLSKNYKVRRLLNQKNKLINQKKKS